MPSIRPKGKRLRLVETNDERVDTRDSQLYEAVVKHIWATVEEEEDEIIDKV